MFCFCLSVALVQTRVIAGQEVVHVAGVAAREGAGAGHVVRLRARVLLLPLVRVTLGVVHRAV